jgi:hypothetical protein
VSPGGDGVNQWSVDLGAMHLKSIVFSKGFKKSKKINFVQERNSLLSASLRRVRPGSS